MLETASWNDGHVDELARENWMNSGGIWFAILAAIFAGAGIYARKHGKPTVRKPLMLVLWALALIAVVIGIGAIFSGG